MCVFIAGVHDQLAASRGKSRFKMSPVLTRNFYLRGLIRDAPARARPKLAQSHIIQMFNGPRQGRRGVRPEGGGFINFNFVKLIVVYE